MNKKLLITGADRGLGLALVRSFLQAGDTVFAGQYMPEWPELGEMQKEYPNRLFPVPLDVSDSASVSKAYESVCTRTEYLDFLINNAGISGGAGDIYELENPEKGTALYSTNALGPLRIASCFLPLLEAPQSEKRLCFVSSEAGSISVCHRADGFLYPMSKAALNMAVKMLFQQLQPKGYSFRLFHPGWVKSYMSGRKSTVGKFEPEESARAGFLLFTEPQPHEDVLRLIDNEGRTWPF